MNKGSIAFHKAMGSEILPGTGEIDGIPVILDDSGEGQPRVRFRRMIPRPDHA